MIEEYTSRGNAFCDCGDPEMWDQKGYCEQHGGPIYSPPLLVPEGKIICNRCDGKIELTPEEWEAKGFPGMSKSNCKLCSATGLLDAPKREMIPIPGKIICTRCDGRIELSPEEWDLKGFPGMARSKCKLCNASGFLDDPLPKPIN